MFGAYCSMVEITVSPNASRFASSQPPSTSYGAYCTKHDITWCPGGAMSRSIIDGMMMSMYGRLRELAVLGVVVGALDVIDARADRDRAAVQRAFARQAGEVRQSGERDVDLARRAAHAEVADRLHELVREMLLVDELQEAALRIGGRHHDLGREFVAVLERDAHRAAAAARSPSPPPRWCGSRRRAPAPTTRSPPSRRRCRSWRSPRRGTRRRSRPCSDAAARRRCRASAGRGRCR